MKPFKLTFKVYVAINTVVIAHLDTNRETIQVNIQSVLIATSVVMSGHLKGRDPGIFPMALVFMLAVLVPKYLSALIFM